MKCVYLFLVVSLLLRQGTCDLPVHCMAKAIQGEWRFLLGGDSDQSLPTCGHMTPDRNTDHISRNFLEDFSLKTEIVLNLGLPDKVLDEKGTPKGRWTMVYDEGFEVFTDTHVFFAFSKYTTINNKVPTDTDDEQTSGYKSICGETFLGWFRSADKSRYGCFYAKKSNQQGSDNDHSALFANSKNKEKIVERRDLINQNSTAAAQGSAPKDSADAKKATDAQPVDSGSNRNFFKPTKKPNNKKK